MKAQPHASFSPIELRTLCLLSRWPSDNASDVDNSKAMWRVIQLLKIRIAAQWKLGNACGKRGRNWQKTRTCVEKRQRNKAIRKKRDESSNTPSSITYCSRLTAATKLRDEKCLRLVPLNCWVFSLERLREELTAMFAAKEILSDT